MGVQVLAGEHLVGVPQPKLSVDGSGGQGVVAGDHFYPDTGTVAFLDSSNGFLTGWVQQAHHTQQFSPCSSSSTTSSRLPAVTSLGGRHRPLPLAQVK